MIEPKVGQVFLQQVVILHGVMGVELWLLLRSIYEGSRGG